MSRLEISSQKKSGKPLQFAPQFRASRISQCGTPYPAQATPAQPGPADPEQPGAPSPTPTRRAGQRAGGRRQFFRGTGDDWTLLFGLIAGVVFFGGIALMSAGTFAADSVVVDETLSKTPLDTGEQCIDRTGEVYFDIWASHDEV